MQYRSLGRTGVQVGTLALGDDPNRRGSSRRGSSRRWLATALDDSLRRLEAHVLPATGEYGMGVLAWSPLASGWLSGAVRAGREVTTNRSKFMPERFDPAVPANQARLDAVEQLAEVAESAGLALIQLALGFVTAHPGVTSALIGPRTMDHLTSPLAAADTVLTADVPEAIDAIVAPGLDLAPDEKIDTPPALLDASLRRR